MIGTRQGHEFLPLRMAGLEMVLEAHFQSAFDGEGAVVRELEFVEPGWYQPMETAGQLNSRLVCKAREYDVFQSVQLLCHGLVYIGIAMP